MRCFFYRTTSSSQTVVNELLTSGFSTGFPRTGRLVFDSRRKGEENTQQHINTRAYSIIGVGRTNV